MHDSAVAMQSKEPRHYTKASDFLLKVFGKIRCAISLSTMIVAKNRLYCIGGLFEIRDRATPPSIHHCVDKEGPLHKCNEFFFKFLFQLANFIKILLPPMLIWMHVTYYWDDHGNMTSMLPIEARETFTCSLGRARKLP